MLTLNINGQDQELDVAADMPLLWVLRDVAHLTGTKFGCGMAQCGACTVHVDGAPRRSCITPATAVAHGQKILTIEGLSTDGTHPVQQAWAELDGRHGYQQLHAVVAEILAPASLAPLEVDACASALNGAINELARWLARHPADEHPGARDAAIAALQRVCVSVLPAEGNAGRGA